jgi:hypothetical protein
MRRFFVGLLVFVSAVLIVLSSTSLWTRRHVVNTDVFVAGAQKILAEPAVQSRIESEIVASVMATPQTQGAINDAVAILPPRLQTFRPSIEDGARSLLSKGVQTILTSPQFATLTGAALRSAQTQLINGQSVEFTLGQAKALIPAQDKDGLAGQVLNLIPNDVGFTVLTKQQAPRVYTAIDLLKTLWLWAGLIALGLLVWALTLSQRRQRTLRAWAVTTAVVSVVLVLSLAVLRGPLLGQVKPVNVDVADAVYQGITASLRTWTLWLVVIMLGITAVTLLWGRIGLVPAVRRGYHAARAQAAHLAENRAAAAAAAQDGTPGPVAPTPSWPKRVAASTQAFLTGLNVPGRLEGLAAFLRRNIRAARWLGVAVGALVLLFLPSPTLSVLIWVIAFVALYIGLIELVVAIGGRAEERLAAITAVPVAAASAGDGAEAPTMVEPGTVAPLAAELPPAPAAPPAATGAVVTAPLVVGTASQSPAPEPQPPEPLAPHPMTADDVAAMGSRLDLLLRFGSARSAGVLTDEEFSVQKAQLLSH